ncbi:diguanylate cyclase domain-containing protein [Salinispirillum marinum]|uniref:Diguanylate cyclase domain-containing protein n=2 Tax=Saccharospirillaceae TaxID=255527 RepID=A0ABV8BEL4_9GAMM
MDVKEELLRSELERLPQKFYRQILTLLPEAVLMVVGRRIVFANEATCRLTGMLLHELVDHHYARFIPRPTQREVMRCFRHIRDGCHKMPRLVFTLQRPDATVVVSVQVAIAKAMDGPLVYLVTLRDITREVELTDVLRQREAKLRYLADHDHLTELLNRKGFTQQLRRTLVRAQRQKTTFALMYIDLDNFKQVNDQHGHGRGDEVLRLFAQRLRECFRESDIVARLGGDEFVVILEDVDPNISDNYLVELLRDHALAPLVCSFGEYHLAASTGVSRFPADGESEESLLSVADERMYKVKGR